MQKEEYYSDYLASKAENKLNLPKTYPGFKLQMFILSGVVFCKVTINFDFVTDFSTSCMQWLFKEKKSY